MTDRELYQLTHSETWPHKRQLPVVRRGGNPVYESTDCGIVVEDNLCRVWTDVHLGEDDPTTGIPYDYRSPEYLLSE